jgi:hypothetical protein
MPGKDKNKESRAYRTISPRGYNLGENAFRYLFNVERKNRDIPAREDAWRMYLGLPQEQNIFVPSEYSPSVATDPTAKYYKYNQELKSSLVGLDLKSMLERYGGDPDAMINRRKASDIRDRTLGFYTIGKGEDERGKYISAYDKWDLHPLKRSGKGKTSRQDFGEKVGIGQPWEYYDRYYYEPADSTNMTQQYAKGGWMQKAAKRMKKKGTVGSFTRWCKDHGYGGVTSEAIAAGLRAGGKIAKKAAFAKAARKAKHQYGGEIGDYSLGGILSSTGSGAAAGAAFGLPGAIVGGGLGLIKGIFGHIGEQRQEDAYEAQLAAYEEAKAKENRDAYLMTVDSSENPFTPTFPYGGQMSYVDAEVEDDEVLQRPSGKLEKMSGKRHEAGGIDVTEPVGTRVYSDREIYEPTGKTFAEEADAIRKRIAELDKML